MHTVVETKAFIAAAKSSGMSDVERLNVVAGLAKNPMAGDMMEGTGGCRKFRVAGRGKGKSGGYRIVTYFGGDDIPVFLITVFGKDEKDNLSNAERNELSKLTKLLGDGYRKRR